MEDRKKELQKKIDSLWLEYLKVQAEADRKQAEANYIEKLHDLTLKELEDLEKFSSD